MQSPRTKRKKTLKKPVLSRDKSPQDSPRKEHDDKVSYHIPKSTITPQTYVNASKTSKHMSTSTLFNQMGGSFRMKNDQVFNYGSSFQRMPQATKKFKPQPDTSEKSAEFMKTEENNYSRESRPKLYNEGAKTLTPSLMDLHEQSRDKGNDYEAIT